MKKSVKKIPTFVLSTIMLTGLSFSVNANDERVNTGRPDVGIYQMDTGKLTTFDENGNEIITYISEDELSDYKARIAEEFPSQKRDTAHIGHLTKKQHGIDIRKSH